MEFVTSVKPILNQKENKMKYRANPVIVDAFKIVDVGAFRHPENGSLPLAIDNGDSVIATLEMLSRYEPVAGDYWVVQSDGYIYVNPKDVFERKYSPVNE